MGFALSLINYAFSFVMIMAVMMLLRGGFGVSIRGEFGLYILSGVSLFLIHNKILSELSGPEKNRSLMPVLAVSPGIMITGALLHTIYMQIMIMMLFSAGIWVYYGGFTIEYPMYAFWIFILCCLWSISMGLCVYSIVPVYRPVFSKLVQAYRRIGVVTSGKMIPGNLMTGSFHGLFAWNPLYHCIDQFRGAIFVNYTPFNSNIRYPEEATAIFFAVAMFLYVALRRFR